ncbi:MAG: phosphoadenylyl-sulfate reductase [Solirubrobacteraceae bacterium]
MRDLELAGAAVDLEASNAEEVLRYGVERFHPRLAMACSFQKEESVLLDMLLAIEPAVRIFTLDTHAQFPEVYETWRAFEDRWGVAIEVFDVEDPTGAAWSAEHCCTDRKLAVLGEALAGAEAWITGLRREQSPTRQQARKLERDERNGLWKLSPLADWGERELWRYIHEHELPYNELHDRGYASIGCAPCTLPGGGREGRWAGSEKTECGLHGEG